MELAQIGGVELQRIYLIRRDVNHERRFVQPSLMSQQTFRTVADGPDAK